ncbi:hypothetical protein GRT45_34385, partial [Burkholderia pseudomallei]|nr:hypothetical protein [Burkholderia pseudomallei]
HTLRGLPPTRTMSARVAPRAAAAFGTGRREYEKGIIQSNHAQPLIIRQLAARDSVAAGRDIGINRMLG